MNQSQLTKTYTITTNYLNQFDDLSPMGILDLFQDIAGRHAAILNAGFEAMKEKGYYWVIVRNEVRIIKEVPPSHNVEVTTWPLMPTRFYFDRLYELRDENGEVCIEGRSRWLIVDRASKRMQPSSVYSYPLSVYESRNMFTSDFVSITPTSLNSGVLYSYTVRPSDLDHNLHFNNARYAELVYNALDIKSKNSIESFLIYYHNECRLGDVIDIVRVVNAHEVIVTGYYQATLVFTSKVIMR